MPTSRILAAAILACSTATLGAADETPPRKPAGELAEVKPLPNPFLFVDGSTVRTKEDWARRRVELKTLFEDYEYGHLPPKPESMTVERVKVWTNEAGTATRQDLKLILRQADKSIVIRVGLIVPTKAEGPVPVVIQDGMGQKSMHGISLPLGDSPFDWHSIYTRRGYAVAVFNFQEVAVANKDHARSAGVYRLFGESIDCGALMAWAWGIRRVIDAIEFDPRIDPKKIVVTGHSSDGKAALLAGAFDERIALTVPSHSGCGGAAPYRFLFGKSEQLPDIVGSAPHWFRPDFDQFVGKVDRLPIDQHLLRALVAPRALLATEGTQDAWANPEGSQLAHRAAAKVYEFLGVPGRIGIQFRPIGHNIGFYPGDEDLIDFADQVFRGKALPDGFGKLAYPEEKAGFSWDVPR